MVEPTIAEANLVVKEESEEKDKKIEKITKVEKCEGENRDIEEEVKVDQDDGIDKDAEEESHEKSDEYDKCKIHESDDFNLDEILNSKIKLSDGTQNFIFSRGPKYSDACWPINCHLCRVGNLINTRQLRAHLKGKSHTSRLAGDPPDAVKYVDPFRQPFGNYAEITTPIRILPGEFITDITPDLEERLLDKSNVPFKLITDEDRIKNLDREPLYEYNKNYPLIGLCYFFKMLHFGKPKYYCGLCHTAVFGEVFQHVAGSTHQVKYIRRHFDRTLVKVENMLKKYTKLTYGLRMKYIRSIFRKLYRKIENEKGLRKMFYVNALTFSKNQSIYLKRCRNKVDHYGDHTMKFADEELKTLVEKLGRGKSIIKPDLISIADEKKGYRDDGLRNLPERERKRLRSPLPDRGGPPSKRGSYGRRDERRFEDDPQDWERYRVMIGEVLDNLDKVYEDYEREPESHPMYDSEWKRFWRRRCADLERDNIDPRYYDFDKEWIPYWMRRLDEYHAKDEAKRKFEMKRTLRLAYDKRSPSPIRRRRPRSTRGRSPSPRRPAYENRRYPESSRHMEEAPEQPSEPLSVISAMRLLTALEDQLGSLGPKAVQLLGRAVLFEKNNLNPNELMLENDFYMFFMTAKEKLKGQLLANIVEPHKIKAVKRAVGDVSTILTMFEEYIARQGGRFSRVAASNIANIASNQFGATNMSNRNDTMGGSTSGMRSQLMTNPGVSGDKSNFSDNSGGISGRSQYSANNSGSDGRSPFSTPHQSQYNGGSQGGVWQSGAYRGDSGGNTSLYHGDSSGNASYRGDSGVNTFRGDSNSNSQNTSQNSLYRNESGGINSGRNTDSRMYPNYGNNSSGGGRMNAGGQTGRRSDNDYQSGGAQSLMSLQLGGNHGRSMAPPAPSMDGSSNMQGRANKMDYGGNYDDMNSQMNNPYNRSRRF